MFRGNNRIIINEATMIQICQTWLDKSIPGSAPTVVSVVYDGATNTFKVHVSDPQIPAVQ